MSASYRAHHYQNMPISIAQAVKRHPTGTPVPRHHKTLILGAEFVRGWRFDRRRSELRQTVYFQSNINAVALNMTAESERCKISRAPMLLGGSRLWRSRASDGGEVELTFASTELRGICESRRRAISAVGVHAARELEQKLADLAALPTVADLAELLSDSIIERSPAEKAIRLKAGYHLVFCAGHVKVPLTSFGATDWAKVSRIRIIALESARD